MSRGFSKTPAHAQQPTKLLDQACTELCRSVRDALRRKHHSYRTEQAYVSWIKRFILFHDKHHPKDMGVPEIEAFLTHLAVEQDVTASSQKQASSTVTSASAVASPSAARWLECPCYNQGSALP